MLKLKKNITLILFYIFNATFFLLAILCAASSIQTANIVNKYPDLKQVEELNSILLRYKDCNTASFFCGLFMLFISLLGLLTVYFGKVFLLYTYITLIVLFYCAEIVLLEFVDLFPSKISARYEEFFNKALAKKVAKQAKIVFEAFKCSEKRVDVNCFRCNFTDGVECHKIAFNENVFYIWTSINSVSIGFLVFQFVFIFLVQKLKENDEGVL